MKQLKENNTQSELLHEENELESESINRYLLVLSYAGGKGCRLVRSLWKQLKRSFPGNKMSDIV